MKDYKQLVLWLDYFNSSFSRTEGRRVRLDHSVKDPKLEELVAAAKKLGLSPEPFPAKFPRRMMLSSGYINIEKKKDVKKEKIIEQIAMSLSSVRGERTASTISAPGGQRKDQPKRH